MSPPTQTWTTPIMGLVQQLPRKELKLREMFLVITIDMVILHMWTLRSIGICGPKSIGSDTYNLILINYKMMLQVSPIATNLFKTSSVLYFHYCQATTTPHPRLSNKCRTTAT